MQDPSDSPVMTDADLAPSAASTVLAEVLPGIAVVFGEVPAELKLDLLDFGLVPAADRGRSPRSSPRSGTRRPWPATSGTRSPACRGSTGSATRHRPC